MRYLVEFSGDVTVEADTEEKAKEVAVSALEHAGMSITSIEVADKDDKSTT